MYATADASAQSVVPPPAATRNEQSEHSPILTLADWRNIIPSYQVRYGGRTGRGDGLELTVPIDPESIRNQEAQLARQA